MMLSTKKTKQISQMFLKHEVKLPGQDLQVSELLDQSVNNGSKILGKMHFDSQEDKI